MIVEAIIHNPRDDNGDPTGGIQYEFGPEATEWEREAIREYGATSKDEVQDALNWRQAMDEMDNQRAARVMRGKHPTKDKDIGRPKNPRSTARGNSQP